MSSTASTQEAELDALFRSHKLDNILPDAFALGAVLSAPTGHLADLYQFLACDPPTPLVLPTDISVFFHNELQNNCGPLNQSDSKLLARIFKNSYRPDNESLRALTLLDTTTTDHVYLYNTMNRSVTAAVEQLAIGLTQQLGLTTVLPSYPVPNDYPTLYRRPATSQEPAAKRNEPPTPRSVSTSVRRAQRTPRHSTGKARKTRSIQLVEPSPSNKATPRQRTSKTSMRAEILPEDKVPVSIRVKRGVNKIGERRKSSANPSSQTASNGLQSPQVTQPAETSPGSSQDLDVSGAGESHRAAHISESETGSLPEIEGNNDPMATPTAKDSSKKGNRRSREDESHEHLYTAKKTRICNSNYKNTATEDKEDGIDDAMIEDETHRLIEDNNGPSGQDQNGTMANAHMDVNDDTSDMTSIPGAGISPSKPSGDAMRDSDSATSPPSEIGDKTPFKIPKSKSLKKNASNSTPSTEDTPSSSRRSTRTQDRVTPGSESRVAVSRRNTSTTLTTPSRFPDKRFKCDVDGCSKSYNRLEHVQRHHQDTHQQLRPYPCPFEQCGKAFSRSYKLNKHIDTHRKSLKKSEDKRVNSRSVSSV